MIRFQRVSKRYRRGPGCAATALRSFGLQAEPGECVALVGPNGAGKSTALGLLLGFLRPTAGSVRVAGLRPARFARTRGVGYLPESYRPPERIRAGALLRRLAALDGLRGREARRRSVEALERVGLGGSAGARVGTLSRGNRQRLGVAQLLLRPRRLILLDEPWSGLDAEGRSRLRRLLGELRRDRPEATLLLASHDLAQVARVADRAVLLDRGRSAGERKIRADDDGEALERWVLGPAEAGAA